MSEKVSRGLKMLRKVAGKKPEHACNNCKCVRYSPCTCQKRGQARQRSE